jgi:hypothetical protein
MSTTTGLPPNVAVYLAALRAELADLAVEERDDLLSEVEPSLLEAAAEGDDPIEARLGPAADFAADLRTSAGLPPAPRAHARPTGLRSALARLASTPSARRAVAVLGELAPVWWAARAYVAVGLLALLLDVGWSVQHAWLPRFGSAAGTALVLAVTLAASLALGLRSRRAGGTLRRAVVVLDVALLVAALPVLDRATDAPFVVPEEFTVAPPAEPPSGVVLEGVAVENIYPYDRKGRLLHDVRLYDNFGRPLDIRPGAGDRDRRQVVERGGERAFNAFPIRHFEPGTRRVARPDAGPEVAARPLRTPPLARR